jgi:hypothetical protein
VALGSALFGGQQIHLDVSLIRLLSQKIVADEAVEVEWAGTSGVDLVIRNFGLADKILCQRLSDARGLLQRSSVGHVDDHLELAFVIERQHLDEHQAERDQRAGDEEQQDHRSQKGPAIARVFDEPAHQAPIQAGEPTFLLRRKRVRAAQMFVAQQAHGGPG